MKPGPTAEIPKEITTGYTSKGMVTQIHSQML